MEDRESAAMINKGSLGGRIALQGLVLSAASLLELDAVPRWDVGTPAVGGFCTQETGRAESVDELARGGVEREGRRA